jgi:chromosome segregation ATPase
MSDDFRQQLETFLTALKADEKQLETSNKLLSDFDKLTFITDGNIFHNADELDSFDHEIKTLTEELHKIKTENQSLKKSIKDLDDQAKKDSTKYKMDTEGLNEKIKILQQSLDMYSNKSNESDNIVLRLENQIQELRNDNINMTTKYKTMLDEIEINNKNIKKNFTLEKTIQDLTEENEQLHVTIKVCFKLK